MIHPAHPGAHISAIERTTGCAEIAARGATAATRHHSAATATAQRHGAATPSAAT
jgi:hypothetical protein